MASKSKDPLLEGLTLPPGFRLTAPRRAVLAAFGQAALAGATISTYRAKAPSYRNTHGWVGGSRSSWGRAEMQAFRMMFKTGWIVSEDGGNAGSGYYRASNLKLKDPLPILAKRLCAVQALHAHTLETAEGKGQYEAELNAIEDTRGDWRALAYKNANDLRIMGEAGLVALYRQTVAAFEAAEAASARYEARKDAAKLLPLPPLDEALAWLVVQEMNKTH